MSSLPVVLVVGSTGVQGGSVARELLANKKFKVRAFVRNPEADTAKELVTLGADIVVGTLQDVASLDKALQGVYGVFSVQGYGGNALECAKNLVDAAKNAGVQVFVQSTVANTGTHTSFPGWGEGVLNEEYWLIKYNTEVYVQEAGFSYFTHLRPAILLENILKPRQPFFYPELENNNVIKCSVSRDLILQWVSGKDVGVWANAVFENPSKFNGKGIALGEDVSHGELVKILSEELERDIKYEEHPTAELLPLGYPYDYLRAFDLLRKTNGYTIDYEAIKSYGIPLFGVRSFVRANKNRF